MITSGDTGTILITDPASGLGAGLGVEGAGRARPRGV
jgi:hypothetical protein